MSAPRTFLRIAARVPLVRQAAALAYAPYFGRAGGRSRLFRGIYRDFAAAVADIPAGRHIGYDNEPSAHRLLDEQDAVAPCDYPAMFWLERIVPNARTLFDWGGYIGTTYLTYRKYVTYPEHMDWIVNDVPAVVALGRQMAARQPLPGLQFTTSFERLAGSDILLAAGALQFIEDPFGPLREATSLPRHIIVNKTPVSDREAAVTLHNLGTAIAPYHLFNRRAFLENFEALGYAVRDAWLTPGLGCEIPFFEDRSISAFSGFYFEKVR